MRSDREWRQWGRRDPLWGVLSTPGRQASGGRPWTDEEVMAQGRAAFPAYLDQWRQYGLSTDSCLEIGCGVGRMTAQLLEVFEGHCCIGRPDFRRRDWPDEIAPTPSPPPSPELGLRWLPVP